MFCKGVVYIWFIKEQKHLYITSVSKNITRNKMVINKNYLFTRKTFLAKRFRRINLILADQIKSDLGESHNAF